MLKQMGASWFCVPVLSSLSDILIRTRTPTELMIRQFKLFRFLQRHAALTSEALRTCERLAQGRYSAMQRPEVEPATC